MSVKKLIPSLSKLYTVYEEIPEQFLDETDVDNYFYHNICDIYPSHHRIVRVSRGINNNKFAVKLFHFCDKKTQQRFILQEEVDLSKPEICSLLDNLKEFLKTYEQSTKSTCIPLPKPKIVIGSTISKDNLFVHKHRDIQDHLDRVIRLSFRFEQNKRCVFSIKKFNFFGNQLVLTKRVSLT